jgi:small-conductance mechanosensitive channel
LSTVPPSKPASFDQIYQNAAAKPPQICYGIPKIMEMVDSPHLSGMTPEAKRCALFMALEAAGAQIEDLLQDAVVRQRALNDYEEKQQDRLRDFEAAILEENRVIQAELDGITSQYMARIQVNVDQVARQQDDFRDWQKRKQQECRRMTEAAAVLVPQGSGGHCGSLTAVLERASAARR